MITLFMLPYFVKPCTMDLIQSNKEQICGMVITLKANYKRRSVNIKFKSKTVAKELHRIFRDTI